MSDMLFFETFAKGKKAAKALKNSKDCVIYTRVSSQQQADNLSLATQLKACTLYAEKIGYNIAATFGGTYESAETDERKRSEERRVGKEGRSRRAREQQKEAGVA